MKEIKPGYKEELTDMFTDGAYEARDSEDPKEYLYRKGKLLRFEFEGSITNIRITKIDRKAKRMWGVHVQLAEFDKAMGHYGHNLDTTDETLKEFGEPYCTDCEVPVSETATEDGHLKAQQREERTLSDGTEIPDEE